MKALFISKPWLYFQMLIFLSFTNGSRYRLPNRTIPTIPAPENITCDGQVSPIKLKNTKCGDSTCVNYELIYLILLENPNQQFDNVFDFLKIREFKYLYGAMETLKLPGSFSPLWNSTADYDMSLMLNYLIMNTGDPLKSDGGVLTLITDMSCMEFCISQLPSYLHLALSQFGDMGYQIQVYLTGVDSVSGSCATYFESLNVTHRFGLPLKEAQSGCLVQPPAKDYCMVKSNKVYPEKPFTNTNNKLIVMGYLLQNWDMQNYENFVRQVTGDCNDNDIIQIVYPEKQGPEVSITPANMDALITPTGIFTFNEADPGQYQITLWNIIYLLNLAAQNTSSDLNTYIFIFTDVDCLWFCHQDLLVEFWQPEPQYIVSTLTSLYKAGFMVKIFQLPKLTATCDSFSTYWGSTGMPSIQTIPVEPGDIDRYSVCLSKRTTPATYKTSTVANFGTTHVAKTFFGYGTTTSKPFMLATDSPKKMSNLELELLIGMTCFCVVLLALIAIFVIICQKRRRRARSRKLALSKVAEFSSSNAEDDNVNDEFWRLPAENLLLNEADVLGHGAFGCVYKGKYKGNIPSLNNNAKLKMSMTQGVDGTYEVAVKRTPDYATEFQRQELSQEIEFMKKLGHHIHVLAMLGYVDHFDDPMIVLEYCENGDLHGHLQRLRRIKSDGELNLKEFVAIAWQIINGLCYLHAHNFVHRDIAARNILLTKNMVAKISDFGLCRHNDSAHYTSKGGKLPLRWMAIECLKFYEFSTKSDIWSYGVTVWEIFSLGESPFQTTQGEELTSYLEAGNRLEFPDRCPDAVVTMIGQCWGIAPEERPSADELRTKLAGLLDESSMYYGYLNFENETRPGEEYVEMKR